MAFSSALRDARIGVLDILPIALAAIPFGLLLGSEAIRRSLSPNEITLMSAIVFAGSAQFLTVSIWSHPAPWIALTMATLLINLRHVLMSASLSRKIESFSASQKALAAFLLCDETWALCERRALTEPLTKAYYAGTALTLYSVWLGATIAGAYLGNTLPPPETIGFDFVFPALFLSLVTGFARNRRAIPVILASVAASLLVKTLVSGTFFILAGGLAGMAAAALLPPESETVTEKTGA